MVTIFVRTHRRTNRRTRLTDNITTLWTLLCGWLKAEKQTNRVKEKHLSWKLAHCRVWDNLSSRMQIEYSTGIDTEVFADFTRAVVRRSSKYFANYYRLLYTAVTVWHALVFPPHQHSTLTPVLHVILGWLASFTVDVCFHMFWISGTARYDQLPSCHSAQKETGLRPSSSNPWLLKEGRCSRYAGSHTLLRAKLVSTSI